MRISQRLYNTGFRYRIMGPQAQDSSYFIVKLLKMKKKHEHLAVIAGKQHCSGFSACSPPILILALSYEQYTPTCCFQSMTSCCSEQVKYSPTSDSEGQTREMRALFSKPTSIEDGSSSRSRIIDSKIRVCTQVKLELEGVNMSQNRHIEGISLSILR